MASIADLILEQGRQQAERIRRSGERRGQLVTSLAQLPTQIAANNRAEQDLAIRQRREATQEQLAQQQLEQGALTMKRIKDDAELKRQLNVVFNSPDIVTKDPSGIEMVDVDKALNVARQNGFSNIAEDIRTIAQGHNAKAVELAKAARVPTKTITVIKPDGTKIERIVEDKPGQEFDLGAEPIKLSEPRPFMVNGQRRLVRYDTSGRDKRPFDAITGEPLADAQSIVDAPGLENEGSAATRAETHRHNLATEAAAAAAAEAKSAGIDVSPNVRTTSRGRQYLDLSLFQGGDLGKAREAANKAGVVPVSKETADALKEVENARMNQQSILDQIMPLLPKDAAGRVLGAPERKLSEIFQTNDQRSAFSSWRTAAINSLRATAGSKGLRINQAEIEQAVNNDIPTLNDTLGTARQKNQNVNTMLDNVETANLGKVKVRDPNGKIHEFDTPAQAAEFRRLAGL